MANPKTPITELDFAAIKEQFKVYLQTQTQFKDYNFEGSNMSALLDVLSFNSYQNNFYTNMALNEMFLDSAVLKNSIVSHAKELNYIPRSRKSAKAVLNLTITDQTSTTSTITVPQYFELSANYQGESYNFVTNEAYTARRTAPGVYEVQNVEMFEGEMLQSFQREGFIVDADGVLRVYLTNNEVDTDSLVVFVDAEATDDANIFTRATTIFGVNPLDKVFYLEPYLTAISASRWRWRRAACCARICGSSSCRRRSTARALPGCWDRRRRWSRARAGRTPCGSNGSVRGPTSGSTRALPPPF